MLILIAVNVNIIRKTRACMRNKRLRIAALVAMFGLQGVALADNANSQARVRVFQEAEITLYPGAYCYGEDNPEKIVASHTGFSIFNTHKRLGMAVTDDIEGSYNEFAVVSDKPVTVKLFWQAEKGGIRASCGPLASTFFPQAGHDYDISMGYSGNCFIRIRELYPLTSDKAGAKPAPFSPSYACKAG